MTEDPDARMERALEQIRREGYKVAAIYAVVDAAAVALFVNAVLQLVPVLDALGLGLVDPATDAAILGVIAGVAAFGTEVAVRLRRPLVEQFEATNPGVREALRTARDAVEDGLRSQIALSLYEDVLDRLQETSSAGLLDVRRLSVTLLVVVGLSLLSVQVAVVDLSLVEFGDDPGVEAPGETTEYAGLQDPDAILGEATDADAGDEDLDATIGTSGDGSGNASDVPRAYDTGGFAAEGAVQSQQAGYTAGEHLEDAALIREYNLRIRGETDE